MKAINPLYIVLFTSVMTIIGMLVYGEMTTRKYTQPIEWNCEHENIQLETATIVDVSMNCDIYIVALNDTLYFCFSDATHGDTYTGDILTAVSVYKEDLIPYKARP